MLVIESDRLQGHALVRVLGRKGFTAELATTPERAGELLAAGRYGVLVLDWDMRDGAAYGLLSRARAQRPSPRLVVVASPENTIAETEAHGLGVDHFFWKPVSGAALAALLDGSGDLLSRPTTAARVTSLRQPSVARPPSGRFNTRSQSGLSAVPQPSHGEPGRVVIVDDDPGVLRMVERVLARAGHQVTSFADPSEALEFLEDDQVDCIVSDINMPKLRGPELIEAVRKFDAEVGAIIMTGKPTVENAVESMRLGTVRYLSKPFGGEQLLAEVAEITKTTRMARTKRLLLESAGIEQPQTADLPSLGELFAWSLTRVRAVAHPVVSAGSPELIIGYFVHLHTDVPGLRNELAMRTTAQRLGRLGELRQCIEGVATKVVAGVLPQQLVFMTMMLDDLQALSASPQPHPLAGAAESMVICIEGSQAMLRSAAEAVRAARAKLEGARFAVLYRGDAGSPAECQRAASKIEADFVVLDPKLILDAQVFGRVCKSLSRLVRKLRKAGIPAIASGIATSSEASTMASIGCDYLSGPLFDAPNRESF